MDLLSKANTRLKISIIQWGCFRSFVAVVEHVLFFFLFPLNLFCRLIEGLVVSYEVEKNFLISSLYQKFFILLKTSIRRFSVVL